MHLEVLRKQGQAKPSNNRQEEMVKLRTDISKIETRIKYNDSKSCFFGAGREWGDDGKMPSKKKTKEWEKSPNWEKLNRSKEASQSRSIPSTSAVTGE